MQFSAIPLPVLHIENSVISKYILPYLKDNKESRQCKHWKLFNSENFQVADSYYSHDKQACQLLLEKNTTAKFQ